MKMRHVALHCERPENCDRFYKDLLGFKETGSKTVSADLMERIFGLSVCHMIRYYAVSGCDLEIFIGPRPAAESRGVAHLCIDVGKREPFLDKCRRFGVEILRIPKPDGTDLIFITDFDGNRFEIKGD